MYVLLVTLMAIVGLSACRGGSAKKAAEIIKKYPGKAFKSSEKSALILRYGDDVLRHFEFQKVSCSECGGDGTTWSGTCEKCSGEGYVYIVKSK